MHTHTHKTGAGRSVDTLIRNDITGIERRITADGYEFCSQLFPDGKRTIKYVLKDSLKIPVLFTFSTDYLDLVWRYDGESSCWYQEEDRLEEHPWRGSFGFDTEGQFFMRDDCSLWLLNPRGTEYRSRIDDKGTEVAIKTNKHGKCIYARSGAREWCSENGSDWELVGAPRNSEKLKLKFELHINGDFVITGPEQRTEIQHKNGSKTVRMGGWCYVEAGQRITLYNAHGGEEGEFVEPSAIAELPDSTRLFKSRVINESSRPILLGAKDADGQIQMHVLDARSSTPFNKNPAFVVEDPRYQVRIVDGRVLVPYEIPASAVIFKLGNQKLKVTNESWGMVLLGWPIAGRDTISGVARGPVSAALRGPANPARKNRSVGSNNVFSPQMTAAHALL